MRPLGQIVPLEKQKQKSMERECNQWGNQTRFTKKKHLVVVELAEELEGGEIRDGLVSVRVDVDAYTPTNGGGGEQKPKNKKKEQRKFQEQEKLLRIHPQLQRNQTQRKGQRTLHTWQSQGEIAFDGLHVLCLFAEQGGPILELRVPSPQKRIRHCGPLAQQQ